MSYNIIVRLSKENITVLKLDFFHVDKNLHFIELKKVLYLAL